MSLNRHERVSVGYVAFLSACVGVGYLLTSVGGLSLFIERVGVERLPILYVIGAALNIAIGTLDNRVLQSMRQGPRLLALGMTGGTIAILIGVFALFGPSFAGGFVAPLAYEVVYIFGPLIASAVALHRFDLRQMKRLYSPASSGRWIAQILAGLVVARFADRVEPGALLIGGGAVLLLAALVAQIAVSDTSGGGRAALVPDGQVDAGPRRRLDRYSLVILVVTITSTIILLVTDFIIFARAEADLEPDAFKSFLSLLHAAQAGLILVLSVFGGRIISRFGIRFGLLVTPATVAVVAVLLLVVTTTDALVGAALAVASILYVLENGFRYALGIPSRQLLFQPLAPVEARRLHGIAEGPTIAVGVGCTSVILATVVAFGGGARAATATLLVLAVISVPIALVARRAYVDALEAAVTRRQLGQGINLSDSVRAQLVSTLDDPDPVRAVSALRLLGDADTGMLGAWSSALLANQHEPVLRLGLDWAETDWFVPSDTSLKTLLTNRPIDWVLRHRAGTLARRRGAPWVDDVVAELVADGDLAGIAMTRHSDAPTIDEVDDVVVAEGTLSERLLLAEVLALNGGPSDTPAILEALADASAEVRRTAAPAIVRLGGDQLWRRAAELVDDHLLYETVADLFDSGRGNWALTERLEDPHLSSRQRTRLARLLARSPNHDDDNPAWKLIADHDPSVRGAVLAELARRRTVVTTHLAESLRADLTAIADRCAGIARTISAAVSDGRSHRLTTGLEELLQRERVSLAHALAVLGYGSPARGLAASLSSESERSQAQALELLEEATTPDDRRYLVALEGMRGERRNADPDDTQRSDDPWVTLLWSTEDGTQGDPMALSTIERVLALRSTPLFAATPSPVLMDFAPGLEERSYTPGEVIFEAGDRGDHLFVILSGSIEVVASGRLMERIDAGEAFGEASLLEDEPRSATARAVTETVVLALDRRAFDDLLIDQPEVSMEMLRYVSRRLRLRNINET